MACKDVPKKTTNCKRALKRVKAPRDASEDQDSARGKRPELAALCLTCGEFVFSADELKSHGKSPNHPVFVTLDSLDLVCTACKSGKKRRNYFDVATVVECDDDPAVEMMVGLVDEWRKKNDFVQLWKRKTASEPSDVGSAKVRKKKHAIDELEDDPVNAIAGGVDHMTIVEDTETEVNVGPRKRKGQKGSKKSSKQIGIEEEQGSFDTMNCEATGPSLFGIANVGNSCFLNSVLQVLAHCPSLGASIEGLIQDSEQRAIETVDLSFSEAVLEILNAVRNGSVAADGVSRKRVGKQGATKAGRVSPRKILGYIMDKAPQLSGFRQHDAHELLVELFRALEEEENEYWKCLNMEKNRRPYIWSLFSSDVKRAVVCEHCGNSSVRVEENVVTSLHLTQKKSKATTMKMCVKTTFAPTKLLVSEGNGLECERCSKVNSIATVDAMEDCPGVKGDDEESKGEDESLHSTSVDEVASSASSNEVLDDEEDQIDSNEDSGASRTSGIVKRNAELTESLSRAPPILIFHLKRFQTKFAKGRIVSEKLTQMVELEEEYSLVIEGKPHKYRLFAVVAHRGSTLNRGHYVCFVRPTADSSTSGHARKCAPSRGQWWFASDSKVMPVEDVGSILDDEGCYLAFYDIMM